MSNKIDIKDIQTDVLIKRYIDYANDNNVNININYIKRMINENKLSNLVASPVFSAPPIEKGANKYATRRVDRMGAISIPLFNDGIKAIKNDVEVIRNTIGEMDDKLSNIERTIKRLTPLMNSAKLRVEDDYKQLRKQMGLARYTERNNINDESKFDKSLSTALINIDKHIIQAKKSEMFANNIDIGELNSDTLQAFSEENEPLAVDSNFYRLFVPGDENRTGLGLVKDNREPTDIVIVASFTDKEIYANTLIIDSINDVPTRTTIEAEIGGETITLVEDEYLVDSIYSFNFDAIYIDKLIVRMEQQVETAINEENKRIYLFSLNNIALEYVNFNDDARFITSAITTDIPITEVMMEATDNRPPGTNIDYYISQDKERWLPIAPKNLFPNSPNTVVNLSLSSLTELENIGSSIDRWDETLSPNNEYGTIAVYNVLDGTTGNYVTDNGSGNVLNIESDEEIIEDSIKLYRGYDDWSITKERYVVRESYTKVEHRVRPPSSPTDGASGSLIKPAATDHTYDEITVKPVLRFDDEGHRVNLQDGDKYITTKYPIANNNLEIIRLKTGRKIEYTDINYNTGKITLEYDQCNVSDDIVITYYSYIENVEEEDNVNIDIDMTSLKYFSGNAYIETNRTDSVIYYSYADKLIHINKNNSLPSTSYGDILVRLSFDIIKQSKDKFRVYKTYVYYSQDTDITIFPFTEEEISAGNFHSIDGEDVSSLNTYTMTGGLHNIVTTQPFKLDPNNPDNDVNVLTNKTSNAGIDLGNYEEKRAFKKPLRKVDINTLSNVIAPGNHETFAYKDGKVFLNFKPEELPYQVLDFPLTTHVKGKEILAKYASYYEDDKQTFNQYFAKKESFKLEYKTHPSDPDDELKEMYVKGELSIDEKTGISPSVFKFEILFF